MAAPAPVVTRESPVQAARLTLADYHALPEGPPFYEFEDGELIPMNRPTANHQVTIGVLFSVIHSHATAKSLGRIWPEVEVDLAPRRGYVPDLAFLATDHLDRLTPEGLIAGAPDLVVEILSPSTAGRDRGTKFRAYQEAGVPWLWLVDSDDLLIEEYRLTPDGYLRAQTIGPGEAFQPGLFPGLTINLTELLGRPAPAE
ncbi:MAG: Uma2 family endonuclease [Chloroflexi bacterium]|nr:Uma2 family endonuclease [Chloroflexota bacterium]